MMLNLKTTLTRILAALLIGGFFLAPTLSWAAAVAEPEQMSEDDDDDDYEAQINALNWVRGPTTVNVVGNSKLDIPAGYRFLDLQETEKYLELNENLADGTEVTVAPDDMSWSAYLSFDDEGYVKDDEKIDGAALLKSLQQSTESSNAERRRRGYTELHVTGWAIEPAYNSNTKRLEWATRLRSDGGENVNFFTKILGRRGYTTVILVSSDDELADATVQLNALLEGYRFNPGDTYAEYKPGDRVARYGLAALVLGGAAALATKKGFWAVLASFFAAAWKFLAVGVVAIGAWLKKLITGRSDDRDDKTT
jgi:uncharacterized membrane-anchored protein